MTNRLERWSPKDNPSKRINLNADGSQTPYYAGSGKEFIEGAIHLAQHTPEDQPYFESKSM